MSAADVIGILGFALHATHKIYDAVQEVRKAPEEVKALQNEALHVRELLERLGVKSPGEEHGNEDTPRMDLRQLVELSGKGEELIAAANKFIEKATKLGDDGGRKVKKMRWLFKGSEAKELTEDFKMFHRALTDICSINTYTTMRSIKVHISSMEDRTISTVGEQTTHMERLLAEHEERITRILTQSLTAVSQQQREGLHQLFDEMRSLRGNSSGAEGQPERCVSVTDERTNLHGSLGNDPNPDSGLQTVSAKHSSGLTDTVSLSHPHPLLYPGLGPLRKQCPLNCRCRCHKQSSTYRLIPRALRSCFGDIRMHKGLLTSLISSLRLCDDAKCVQTRENLSIVKWYLPTLFARVSAEVEFQSLPIHFVIQTPRVVNSLDFLYYVSLEGLRIKLSTREITVNDVDLDGASVLHRIAYMIVMGHDQAYENMRCLLDAGAPRDWEYEELTVPEYVTEHSARWLSDTAQTRSSLQSFTYNIAKPLFQDSMEDVWERIRTKRKWSDLHYLLANPPNSPSQLQRELTKVLEQPCAALDVNAKDRFGRTALPEAVGICPSAVDPLLRAGSNPFIVPALLIDTVRTMSWSAIGPLVRAGADTNECYRWSNGATSTALHGLIRWWSYLGPGCRLPVALELIRHAGHLLDWDTEDELRQTPLDPAEWLIWRHPDDEEAQAVHKLYRTRKLPIGAQLIDKTRLGEGAGAVAELESMSLIGAGLAGNIEAIGALIDAGAMVNERDAVGRTLLHLVAMGVVPNGYAIALEVVRHGGYEVDWDALTVDGEMAEELANDSLKLEPPEDKDQRRETLAILCLLQQRVLPDDMDYMYPCMHPDYCRECSARPCSGYCRDGLRMPGQWR